MSVQCRKCGRALRNTASMEAGVGPICAKKAAESWETPENGQVSGYVPCTIREGFVGVRKGGGIVVNVVRNGIQTPLRHWVRHSPTGMEWGYGGSGPADLAYSILCEVVDSRTATALHQEFKWEFVAGMKDRWELDMGDVLEWIEKRSTQPQVEEVLPF